MECELIDVQMQRGGCDCGLFTAAFMTAVAFGKDPARLTFDQTQLRSHFVACLAKMEISMFPTLGVRKPNQSQYEIVTSSEVASKRVSRRQMTLYSDNDD